MIENTVTERDTGPGVGESKAHLPSIIAPYSVGRSLFAYGKEANHG